MPGLSTNYGLGFLFSARDLASGTIGQVNSNMQQLGTQSGLTSEQMNMAFAEMGAGVSVFTAGAGLLVGAFGLAQAAGEFDRAIVMVGQVSGATTEQLEQLSAAAIQAGLDTQFSPVQAAEGLMALAQAGFTTQQSLDSLLPVLDLAAASMGQLTVEESAALAAQTVQAFGVGMDDLGMAVDQMLQVTTTTAMSTGDLALSLGILSRGAQVTGQSFDEALIAMGLVKNVIPTVERASTALTVTMERLAETDVQEAMGEMGVQVVNADGTFRDFLDIVNDLSGATVDMTEAGRAAWITETFGAHAVAGLSAVMTQLQNGIAGANGTTVRGAEAIEYLRSSMDNATGAAAGFRDAAATTLPGALTLLTGSMQTLGIVVGEPFAQLFRPIIEAVTGAVNFLVAAIQAMPESFKRTLSTVIMVTGGFLAFAGALLFVRGMTRLLRPQIDMLKRSMLAMLRSMLPYIAVIAAIALPLIGVFIALDDEVGGFSEALSSMWEDVQLVIQAVIQLFSQGGFSGAVREAMLSAENEGLLGFVVGLYRFAYRVKLLLEGIWNGFVSIIEELRPVFEDFMSAINELGDAISGLFSDFSSSAENAPVDRMVSIGEAIGSVFGTIVGWITEVITFVVRFVTVAIGAFRRVYEYVRPAFEAIGSAIGSVIESLGSLFSAFAGGESSATGFWDVLRGIAGFLADILGPVLAAIGYAIAAIAYVISGVIDAIVWLGTTIGEFFGWVYENLIIPYVVSMYRAATALGDFFSDVWDWLKEAFYDVLDVIIDGIDLLPDELIPDEYLTMIHQYQAIRSQQENAPAAQDTPTADPAWITAMQSGAVSRPAETEAGYSSAALQDAIVTAQRQRPIELRTTIEVDGEVLANQVQRVQGENQEREFVSGGAV